VAGVVCDIYHGEMSDVDVSTRASVDLAVKLVRQAVNQDSSRNYQEAARCYREAIIILQDVEKSQRSTCKQLQNFLNTKLVQYEERLRIIEQHLLSKSDLTKFFKELESCHFDDCRSSVSSDTKHLYKNPQLVKALDLIRRGRKDDERQIYPSALASYESGLSLLLDVLNKGLLTPKQEETARIKYLLYQDRVEILQGFLEKRNTVSGGGVLCQEDSLSLDSECDSPVPTTDTDHVLEMSEIRGDMSRLGSTSSLCDNNRLSTAFSSNKSLAKVIADGACKNDDHLAAQSLHSLYPVCEIKHSPSNVSVSSGLGSVPLANISKEFTLSEMSIASTPSSTSSNLSTTGRKLSKSVMSNIEKISVLEISADDDTIDQELAILKLNDHQCDDNKSEGSDSGYSDPSPDGTIRDSKSPSGSLDITDRKSPFSDLSEHDGAGDVSVGEVIPNVIIVNEAIQQQDAARPRQTGRQLSRFQNPNKDILISQLSRDKVSVVADEVDGARRMVKHEPSVKHHKKGVTIASSPDVYTPRVRGTREVVPPRAVAREPRGEHGEMNQGCYYVMAALDFCWCL